MVVAPAPIGLAISFAEAGRSRCIYDAVPPTTCDRPDPRGHSSCVHHDASRPDSGRRFGPRGDQEADAVVTGQPVRASASLVVSNPNRVSPSLAGMLSVRIVAFSILPAVANLTPGFLNFIDRPFSRFLCFLGGFVGVFAHLVRRSVGLFFRRPSISRICGAVASHTTE